MCPKHVELMVSAIKLTVTSSWIFFSTHMQRCTDRQTSNCLSCLNITTQLLIFFVNIFQHFLYESHYLHEWCAQLTYIRRLFSALTVLIDFLFVAIGRTGHAPCHKYILTPLDFIDKAILVGVACVAWVQE